ncbi:TetR/AcrR family transcriptional regulator [Rhizobium sp. S-51]|uniref:TetR/AcrR family transcriptional regulator n=1 Tax=Rhizobium terricola TaxID=2728849 RepID=A0A7Y0AV10_9HYPH|nr:TetR/AcrR family transcriptional regulator [Rhizobium terricola]NML73959.1 TetR/AcrR family transcriptional regulator [Rhizobium terricola]
MDHTTQIPIPASAASSGARTKRDAIIDAAAAIFSESGYSGASIDAIAARAEVSRQTVYNQIGDKEKVFKAVVADVTQRSSAAFFAVLETFPDAPKDLEVDLVAFAVRLLRVAVCEPSGRWLLRLLSLEGTRHPELFATWREYGPGRKHPAMAARFALLAHGGYLDVEDPSLAARQFMALVMSDVRSDLQLGIPIPESELDGLARNAVRTFLKAFSKR